LKRLWVIIFPLFFAACSLIDDDLTACGEDLSIDYQLQLHTELSLQLQTELMLETEEPVRNALEKWLAPIFTDKAKDIDLSFFSAETDELQHYIHEIINDNRTSYTFQLPKENYVHLGIANLEDNAQIQLANGAHAETMELVLNNKSESASFSTGVFTAREHMEIGDTSQNFDVRLYMATCAIAVVVDTTRCDSLVSMSGFMSGSAESFSVRDSVYTYSGKNRLLLEEVPIDEKPRKSPGKTPQIEHPSQYTCLGVSSFPTADDQSWSITVTSTLTGNRRTKTTLTVAEPVQAGTLRLVRVHVRGDGGLEPDNNDQEVGVTVELDWKQGGEHEIEI
jgi:hypothetical protein